MISLNEFSTRFQGIIGALLGVITTFIMTQLIRKIGKTYFYFSEWKGNFYSTDNYGGYREVSDITKTDSYYYKFKLQIYNNSEINKVFRDIKIVFHLQYNIVESIPNDVSKQSSSTGGTQKHELSFINVLPKQMLEFKVDSFIENNLLELGEIKEIYFVAKDYRNRKIKKLIKKID